MLLKNRRIFAIRKMEVIGNAAVIWISNSRFAIRNEGPFDSRWSLRMPMLDASALAIRNGGPFDSRWSLRMPMLDASAFAIRK
jgi:hypothetical protein